jgi:hypothetical protein
MYVVFNFEVKHILDYQNFDIHKCKCFICNFFFVFPNYDMYKDKDHYSAFKLIDGIVATLSATCINYVLNIKNLVTNHL